MKKTRIQAGNSQLGLKRKKKINWVPYVFIAPNFIGFFVFILLPVVFSLFISFTDFNLFQGIKESTFVGLKNFIEMFKDSWFRASIRNNIIYTIVTIPISMFFSIILAVILNKNVYGKNVLKAMFFIPYISSIVAISAIWIQLFNPSKGMINQLLKVLGISNPPGWIGSLDWALPAIIIVGIWMGLGYNIIIYIAGLQSIPKELYESAQIDGANSIKTFLNITVPLVRNTTFFLIITNIITSFQVFGTVNIMTNGGPGTATTVISQYIYVSGFRYYKMGYAAAMAWILLIIIFMFTMFQWKVQKRYESNF